MKNSIFVCCVCMQFILCGKAISRHDSLLRFQIIIYLRTIVYITIWPCTVCLDFSVVDLTGSIVMFHPFLTCASWPYFFFHRLKKFLPFIVYTEVTWNRQIHRKKGKGEAILFNWRWGISRKNEKFRSHRRNFSNFYWGPQENGTFDWLQRRGSTVARRNAAKVSHVDRE